MEDDNTPGKRMPLDSHYVVYPTDGVSDQQDGGISPQTNG